MDKYTRTLEVAKRILELTPPWEREDLTAADVAKVINADPIGTIEHLVGLIEDLQA